MTTLRFAPERSECLRPMDESSAAVWNKDEAKAILNEIQHQFTILELGNSLVKQYSTYIDLYSIYQCSKGITTKFRRRQIGGVIRYALAFCRCGIGDIVFQGAPKLFILTLEDNNDFFLVQHAKTRIEASIDTLRQSKRNPKYARRAAAGSIYNNLEEVCNDDQNWD